MNNTGGQHQDSPPGSELRRRLADGAQDIAYAVGAQGLVSGLMSEGLAADLIGAGAPTVLSLTTAGGVYAYRRWLRRGTRVIEVASEETDRTPDELADAIRGSEAASELFARVMEAAAATRLEDKIYALGKALALGVSEPEHLDEAHMLVEALAAIEEPHAVLLGQIVGAYEHSRTYAHMEPAPAPGQAAGPFLLRHDIEALYPRNHLPLRPVIARLTAAGLLYNPSPGGFGGAENYAISAMGLRCLELLREAANHPQ